MLETTDGAMILRRLSANIRSTKNILPTQDAASIAHMSGPPFSKSEMMSKQNLASSDSLRDGKLDDEAGSVPWLRMDPYSAFLLRHKLFYNGQPQPRTMLLTVGRK